MLSPLLSASAEQTRPFDLAFWLYYASRSESSRDSPGPRAIQDLQRLFLPSVLHSKALALLRSPYARGLAVKAYRLARLFAKCESGSYVASSLVEKDGTPIRFQGAENCDNVMCYLDSLLFAMFASLDSFEPMLFPDRPARLSALLRLNISMLRAGDLVPTDITRRLCELIADAGFKEAVSRRQQDCAALFVFLADCLAMPLLTFKIDITHSGKFNKDDDEKYCSERILYLGLPEAKRNKKKGLERLDEEEEEESDEHTDESDEPIRLEECLEHYLHNTINVRREQRRRATLAASDPPDFDELKRLPRAHSSSLSKYQASKENIAPSAQEVSLLASMALRLLPYYTVTLGSGTPTSTPRPGREFVDRRPVLPLCLKRYAFTPGDSRGQRLSRRVIISPVIRMPALVATDDPEYPAGQTFRFVLESAVCHRGSSIDDGHFVAAIRKSQHDESDEAQWLLYNDMKTTGRVEPRTFKEIFETEWPYLLFYRLVAEEALADTSLDSPQFSSSFSQESNESLGSPHKLLSLLPEPNARPSSADSTLKFFSDHAPPKRTLRGRRKSVMLLSNSFSSRKKNKNKRKHELLPTDPDYIDVSDLYYWHNFDDKNNNYTPEKTVENAVGEKGGRFHHRRHSDFPIEKPKQTFVKEPSSAPGSAVRNGTAGSMRRKSFDYLRNLVPYSKPELEVTNKTEPPEIVPETLPETVPDSLSVHSHKRYHHYISDKCILM